MLCQKTWSLIWPELATQGGTHEQVGAVHG